MLPLAALAFQATLNPNQRAALMAMAAHAVHPHAPELQPWRCGTQALGCLPEPRAVWLAQHLPGLDRLGQQWVWQAAQWTAQQRSTALQNALLQAREQGLLTGWRHEPFSFWYSGCVLPDPQQLPLFSVERAGFRFLGLQSHAVHVNGFLADGRLWCARRSMSKATDPGLLDNLTAGGLPSGETVHTCLLRELAEEAGLYDLQGHRLQAAGHVRTARLEPQGWHDEVIHVFNLSLAEGFCPVNQDGEVAEFLCLDAPQVLQRIEAGAFTEDAVQSLVQGLQGQLAL